VKYGIAEVTNDCPLSYKNGLWCFKDRLKSWQELGVNIFDDHLDIFKSAALEVLQVDDPSFELPSEERYAAAIHGKVLPHSRNLREGLAETLALIGNRANSNTTVVRLKQASSHAIPSSAHSRPVI
jgi:hypothetical protein